MLKRLELSEEHASWLEAERKIPCELAAELGVVSKGKDIAFAYRRNGAVSYMKVRKAIIENGESSKTFWIEPVGVSLQLWNEDCLSELSGAPLIITEGEFDALSCLAAGATHAVSVPNGASNRPGDGDVIPIEDRQFAYLWEGDRLKPQLREFKKIILATDNDEPGRILRDELAIRLGQTRCWYVTYPLGCKDSNDVLVKCGAEALRDMIAQAKPMVPDRLVSFSDIPSRADAQRYSSGWSEFDQHFMLIPPQLIIVTGKPNHGKSQFTLALVANFARLHGLKGAILQFEDNPERNRRDLLRYARAWEGQEQNGINEDPVAWVDRMFKTISPSENLDGVNFDLDWLKAAIEEAATRHGCRWVVIDPWNEVEHLWGKQDTEAIYLNRALREVKQFARRFQIAIFVVAHPTKEGGKVDAIKDATLYDVNGGAVWNNKADLGVIVWADDPRAPDRVIKVAKSKDFIRMGVPGMVGMRFDPRTSTFASYGL